jgi:hypothetical protein
VVGTHEESEFSKGKGHLLSSFAHNIVAAAPVTLESAIVVESRETKKTIAVWEGGRAKVKQTAKALTA